MISAKQTESQGQLRATLMSSALVSALLWLALLLALISLPAVQHFWPSALYQWQLEEQQIFGRVLRQQQWTANVQQDPWLGLVEDQPADQSLVLLLVDQGQNAFTGHALNWFAASQLGPASKPEQLMLVQMQRQGQWLGMPQGLRAEHYLAAEAPNFASQLHSHWRQEQARQAEAQRIESRQLLGLNQQLAQMNPDQQGYAELLARFESLRQQIFQLRVPQAWLELQGADGRLHALPLNEIQYWQQPNALRPMQQLAEFARQWQRFVFSWPSLGHTQGGIWPALVGTVAMTLLMTIMVMPLGVLAGIYLHEYAGGAWRRLLQLVVYNLAGIPAIVYGVFGLGLFVYLLGAQLDSWWFADQLPRATLGTPGWLWVSLTLALLTLPVVIVNTAEGLARIPLAQREACYALGLTKSETLLHLILPLARPAMLTGLILAVARAAGEVAPVMLVGVVRSTSQLPVDAQFPFVHLDRKLMHLAYHIYDLGFQSANIEAGRPLVFASALVLIVIVLLLNLTAIRLRHRLREAFRQQEM